MIQNNGRQCLLKICIFKIMKQVWLKGAKTDSSIKYWNKYESNIETNMKQGRRLTHRSKKNSESARMYLSQISNMAVGLMVNFQKLNFIFKKMVNFPFRFHLLKKNWSTFRINSIFKKDLVNFPFKFHLLKRIGELSI